MNEKKILAVIVTYNRVNDLKNCVNSLRRQTYKYFDILVVNNGSTDGTKEFVDSLEDIIVIHQDNLGGAGGFFAGQKYMMEKGYDWIWMMDDDGIAENNQLLQLVEFTNSNRQNLFVNALVVDKDEHDSLAFHSNGMSKNELMKMESYDGFIHPFNGTFVNRKVFETCGLTKKEMFIWGDEIELTMRFAKAGFKATTVCHAIHYHPKEKGIKKPLMPGIMNRTLLIKPKKFSKHFYRNLGYIHGQYFHDKWYKGFKPMVFYSLFFMLRLDFPEAYKVLNYYLRGMRNDYSEA